MIENAMRLAVDPLFPPPHPWPNSKKNHIPDFQSENKFELVFNEATDAAELNNMPFHSKWRFMNRCSYWRYNRRRGGRERLKQ